MAINGEEQVILQKVEELRQRLARAVGRIKSLNDERVVELSQELDWYLLQIQKKNSFNSAEVDSKKKMTEDCCRFTKRTGVGSV